MKMNKKGQADLVGNFLSTIPKPVLFIFFIMLLAVIGFMLNPVFNSFGIYCKSNEEVVKVPNSDLFSNIALMSKLPGYDDIAGESIEPNRWVIDCKKFYNGSFRYIQTGCSECELDAIIYNVLNEVDLCVADAYELPKSEMSWYKRNIYCPLDSCKIPDNYYYEVDSGLYECSNPALCTDNSLSASRDAKLDEVGGVPLYTSDVTDGDYRKVFMFSCSSKLRVEPTIAGIPFLNPAIWLILMLIIIILWVGISFKPKN